MMAIYKIPPFTASKYSLIKCSVDSYITSISIGEKLKDLCYDV